MISPQGYSLGEEPKAKNPFWDGEGEDSDVNRIFATAQVQGQTGDGAASVETNKTISGSNITFGFLFKNIIGKNGVSPTVTVTDITGGHRISITDATSTHTFDIIDGVPGQKGDQGVSPDVSVREIVGGHIVTITDATGSESFTVMNGTQGEKGDNGDTPVITITATQDGEPVTVTKTGTDAAPNFNIALTGGGGGGSTGGTIGWGTYGPEVAGNYPRSKKETHTLEQAFTVNESGTSSQWISGSHEYSWTLTGTIPADFLIDAKYTPEMTPSGSTGYIPSVFSDVSQYLTATITPQDEMTADNISVRITSVSIVDQTLQLSAEIKFMAHYNGTDMDGGVYPTLTVPAGGWSSTTAYAYLEVLPEA